MPVSFDLPHSLLCGTDHRRPQDPPRRLFEFRHPAPDAATKCRLLSGAAGLGASGRRGGTNRQHARQRKAAQRSMSASRPQPDHRHHRLLHNQPGLAFSSRFRRDVTGTRRAHARRTRFVRPSLDNNKGATGGTLCARPRPRQKRDASHRPAAMKCPDKGRPRGAE